MYAYIMTFLLMALIIIFSVISVLFWRQGKVKETAMCIMAPYVIACVIGLVVVWVN